jgi:hypothetical protein
MTDEDFRQLALSFPETEERSHMQHPDFRVRGKIFGSLGPEGDWGMAKLTPEQQAEFMAAEPGVYKPASGSWGRSGYTIITLAVADKDRVAEALHLAWLNATTARSRKKKA